VDRIVTLTDQVDASIVPERLIATLSGFFGVLGAVLAAIGLYGLLTYIVVRRTNEIGIRIALGARSSDVIRMVIQDAAAVVGAGLLFGIPMAMWGRRLAAALVQDLTVSTSTGLVIGIIAIGAVACTAAFVPALRAARVDPMEALRHE
jgi:putative ABC transport system permease protein